MWGANWRFFSKYSAFTLILYLKGNINSRGNVSCYYFRILESNRIEEDDQNQPSKKIKKSDINTPNSDKEKSIEFPQNIRDLYNCDWQEQGHNFGVNPKYF